MLGVQAKEQMEAELEKMCIFISGKHTVDNVRFIK